MEGSRHLRAAGWLVGVALLCLLGIGDALPFPDFGIPGPIPSSAKVRTAAGLLSADFNNVDEYGIVLESSYTALASVRDILYAIGTAVSTTGMAIGTAFDTLAPNMGPSIDTVFNAATSSVTAMETLLTSGLSDELASLEAIIGTYVKDEFGDSFAAMGHTLVLLREAVGRLKPAVELAKTASKNSATIAPPLINKYVTPKMVADVLDALYLTRANVQVITYTVSNTLAKLEVADEFIIDITGRAESELAGVESAYETYAAATTESSATTSASLGTALGEGYATETGAIAPIQGALDGFADYTTNFQPLMTTIEGILGTESLASFGLDISERITTYLDQVAAVDDDASTFFSDDACQVIFDMVHVLIDNGPYSTFCFEKFSHRAYNLFPSFVDLVSECYDDESVNLDVLYAAVVPLVQLILYDVEDLAEALTTCVSFPNDALCFSMISPLYEVLLALTTTKRDYILDLFMHETDASVLRFSACYYAQKFVIIQEMYTLNEGVLLCETEGPAAD